MILAAVPERVDPARCPVCDVPVDANAPLLIVYDDGLIGAVFVPRTGTPAERDGEDGARLVRAAAEALGRPVFDEARPLTSAPARLAGIVAGRIAECDAVAPARVLLNGVAAERTADYRAWLSAIRVDVGIAAIVDAVAEILSGDRWAEVLAACRGARRVGAAEAARVVDRTVEIAAAGADDEVAAAIGRRAALLTDWRAIGGDPAELVLDERHGLEHQVSLGVQAQIDAYFSGRDDAIGDRIARLRGALAADETSRAPSVPVTIALLAALSAQLHARRGPGDLDEALGLLASAIGLAQPIHGPDSRDVLRLEMDRAVVELDHPDRHIDAARVALGDIQRRAAVALDAGDALQCAATLNLATAWLEEGGTTDRGQAQEEGIAWLEQTLTAAGITPELEILASANLAAALRVRLTRRRDDERRADALHRTACGWRGSCTGPVTPSASSVHLRPWPTPRSGPDVMTKRSRRAARRWRSRPGRCPSCIRPVCGPRRTARRSSTCGRTRRARRIPPQATPIWLRVLRWHVRRPPRWPRLRIRCGAWSRPTWRRS